MFLAADTVGGSNLRSLAMSDWWIFLVIAGVVAIAVVYFVTQRHRSNTHRDDRGVVPDTRDYVQERETNRLGNMSAEDQAWQAASLSKDRTTRERDQG